ncbi:MAG: response regulator transcription factor [Pirellula sp.]
MKPRRFDFLFVSDNRLLAEVTGAALIEQGAIDSFLHVRKGNEISQLRTLRETPDVLVLDEQSHADVEDLYLRIRRIKEEFPQLPLVVIGECVSGERVAGCIVSGASTFVLASDSLAELVATLESLKNGKPRCSNLVIEAVLCRIRELSQAKSLEACSDANTLTQREIEVLSLVEKGMLNKEIARRLGIAVSTVKNHLHAIFEKFEVTERREAVRRGIASGILNCQPQDAVA